LLVTSYQWDSRAVIERDGLRAAVRMEAVKRRHAIRFLF